MVELEDVQSRFGALHQPLIDAHIAAAANWATFLKEHPHLARPCDSTARANILHCHIRSEVAPRVADMPGVKVTDCLGFVGLKIHHDILLRFKFVGHGAPSNVATTQQKLLARQEFTEDMTLALTGDPALTPPTLLTCGYTLDGEKIGRIEIRRDCKGHLPWMYDIYGGTTVVRPTVFEGLEDTAKPAKIRKTTERKKDGGTGESKTA
jgi:hypothetical protein